MAFTTYSQLDQKVVGKQWGGMWGQERRGTGRVTANDAANVANVEKLVNLGIGETEVLSTTLTMFQ